MGKMTPPNNGRSVLTWVRDRADNEFWQLDRYVSGFWNEASAWGQEVLYWQEEPKRPQLDEKEK